jgi:hypothetical protein
MATNQEFDCFANNYRGVMAVSATIDGWSGSGYFSAPQIYVDAIILGSSPGSGFNLDAIIITATILGEAFPTPPISNWVAWGKIGSIDFTQDRTNDAGMQPMSWNGEVYRIMQLGKNAVVYGDGGVTVLQPVSSPFPTFGIKELMKVGILSRTAICGNISKHFCLDKTSRLWVIIESVGKSVVSAAIPTATMLGYEEFLADLVNPIMLYDYEMDHVHVCDADTGYLLTKDGLGEGYPGLTALAFQQGVKVVGAPVTLTTPPTVEFATDVIDMGIRGLKTIEVVEVGTDVTKPLFAAIDYRYDKSLAFVTGPWQPFNKEGIAYARVTGVEFRVRIKSTAYSYFEVDYLTVHYKVTDKRAIRGPGAIGKEQ